MATLISLDKKRIWEPSRHMFANSSFSKLSSHKQQELPPQKSTDEIPQGDCMPPRNVISHCPTTSDDVITISSDEESDTDGEDNQGMVQIPRPLETCSSVAESDALGELVESYCRGTHEHHPRLLNTTDDNNMTSPTPDAVDTGQTDLKRPLQSSSIADDSTQAQSSQFVFVAPPDEMLPEPTCSFDVALESDDKLYPSHQLESRSATLLDHETISSPNDTTDASTKVWQATKSHPLLVQSGTRSTNDVTVQNPIDGGQLTDVSSGDAQDLSGHSPERCHTVESKRQCLDSGITIDGTEGRPREHNPRGGSNKRRRFKDRKVTGELCDSDDEYIPSRKVQKASPHHHKRNGNRYRKSRRLISEQRARDHENVSTASDQNLHTTIASYEEWLLSDAVLKCIRDNGTMTFQMQFTHNPSSTCGVHTKDQPKDTDLQRGRAAKPKTCGLLNGSPLTPKQDSLVTQASQTDPGASDIYKAEILARWRKNLFFLKWDVDGSTGWEPRKNILDKNMLHNFESSYTGFDEGVDVLDTRNSKRQYLLHFHGRPQSEDCWVNADLLSPTLLEKVDGL